MQSQIRHRSQPPTSQAEEQDRQQQHTPSVARLAFICSMRSAFWVLRLVRSSTACSRSSTCNIEAMQSHLDGVSAK